MDDDLDSYLYGEEAVTNENTAAATPSKAKDETSRDNENPDEAKASVSDDEDMEDSDEDDDDIEIVLDEDGEPPSAAQEAKRSAVQLKPSEQSKPEDGPTNVQKSEKKLDEVIPIGGIQINGIGELNGISILDFDLDSGDKPWNKPGADITDYFNYGFNEQTWRQYCLKQKTMREELGFKDNYKEWRQQDFPLQQPARNEPPQGFSQPPQHQQPPQFHHMPSMGPPGHGYNYQRGGHQDRPGGPSPFEDSRSQRSDDRHHGRDSRGRDRDDTSSRGYRDSKRRRDDSVDSYGRERRRDGGGGRRGGSRNYNDKQRY